MITLHIWRQIISEMAFQANPHLDRAFDATPNVINGKTVHIPQAGSLNEPVLNPSSFPLSVSERTDTDIVYQLDMLAMPPVRIAAIDEYELSYDKMQSVLSQQMAMLSDRLGTRMIYEWVREAIYSGSATAAAAPTILTTGTATAAHLPSATGNRSFFVIADLKAAKKHLDKQNVPADGRVAIMSPDMYEQLVSDATLTNYRIQEFNIVNGVMPKLYGFEIVVRPKVVAYKNETDLVNLASYTADATDCDAVVCYHRDFVEMAKGEVDFFPDERNPLYLGSLYSAFVRFGGRKRYADATGIVCIVQNIPA